MKPGKLDLPTIWRGCDWGPVTFKWKNNGVPVNLTGWRARAYSRNIDLGALITDYPGGVVTLSLDRTQTAALKLGVEMWDYIFERLNDSYRFPPFLRGEVPIMDPVVTVPPELAPPEGAMTLSALQFALLRP